jgi:hypothetical protein
LHQVLYRGGAPRLLEQGAQGGNLGKIVRAVLDEYFSQESKYETTNSENYVY